MGLVRFINGFMSLVFMVMKFISRLLIVTASVLVLGLVGFLAAWDMAPPTARVEKVIPNERFLQ